MIRLDIFANQALSDIIERDLNKLNSINYTLLRDSAGKGHKGFCLGNDVWPEHNVVFIIYCNKEQLPIIEQELRRLKEKFPIIGLSCFCTDNVKELI
ncbi:MAG: hypothetical protein OCD02_00135 [Spirochaetaceae bacterium]